MRIQAVIFALLLFPAQVLAVNPARGLKTATIKIKAVVRKRGWTLPAHLVIGAGTQIAVSSISGWRVAPGLVAAGAVAGFKEGTDVHDRRDTWKSAALDVAEIMAGAAVTAALQPRR